MLGWEFAPIIAGGLGVVAKSITMSLATTHGSEVTYVLPRIPKSVNLGFNRIHFKNAAVDVRNVKFFEAAAGLNNAYASPSNMGFYSETLSLEAELRNSDSKQIYGRDLLNETSAYARQASRIAATSDFEVVHNHDWMTAEAAMSIKNSTGKPMVMHVHATEHERTLGNPNSEIYSREVTGMNYADKIIAVSELTKERIVANYGITPDKIEVVHNAVEQIEAEHKPIARNIHDDDKVVLFLARMTAMKGAHNLLEAAPLVLKHQPNTKFVFVGTGELLEELIEHSAELGIADKVTFTGFLNHNQVDRVYRFADVFVLPSVAEPFGITPLEAIKNGTPVLISKQAGVSEVVQNALKVDFWDVREMANKLIAVLKHDVLAEELVTNSKQDLVQLNWDQQTAKIVEIYRQLKSNYNYQYAL